MYIWYFAQMARRKQVLNWIGLC